MYKVSGNIVDPIKKEIYSGILSISNDRIIKIEKTDKKQENYILPGFIDSHIHLESSMLLPVEFAKVASSHGSIGCICDPHEITNVLGIKGFDYIIDSASKIPFKFFFGVPSCVPASTNDTSGAILNADAVGKLLERKDTFFLAEMMDFPGVIKKDNEIMKKIAYAEVNNKPIDGHAPGLTGSALEIYFKRGITTDHESFSLNEAKEKINMGMKIQIRNGSAAKNFDSLYQLIDEFPDMVMLCSDDLHPDALIHGHINLLVRKALAHKINIFNILQASSVNPVKHYQLDFGLLQENDKADFIIIDSLEKFNILKTYVNGKIVFGNETDNYSQLQTKIINKFITEPKKLADYQVKAKDKSTINVIELVENQLITRKIKTQALVDDNNVISNVENDILKIAVISRYDNKLMSVGFIKGFNLKKGAMATSVSHDSHNIIAVGTNDNDLCKAANLVIQNNGGMVFVDEEKFEILKLPVAGIISDQDAHFVSDKYAKLEQFARNAGSKLETPFMTLSFMALSVIPDIKITSKGLFDFSQQNFIKVVE